VTFLTHCWIEITCLAQQQQAKPLILKLDGATRARVLAALAGFVILGFAMVMFAWMGARATRRYMNSGSDVPIEPPRDEWARNPMGVDSAEPGEDHGKRPQEE